jgi:hypothetical protein
MAVQEVVEILQELAQAGEGEMATEYGLEAVSAAEDIRFAVMSRLEELLPYQSLWEDFVADPEGAAEAELIGALEALVEADTALAQELNVLLEEYYQAVRSSEEGSAVPSEPTMVDEGEVAPPTRGPQEGEDDYGEGTYLYGNLEPGSVEVGEGDVEVEPTDQMPSQVEVIALDDEQMASIFEPVYAFVRDNSETWQGDIDEVEAILEDVRALVSEGDDTDPDLLLRRLRMLRRKAPEVLEVLLQRMDVEGSSIGVVIQQVLQDV